MKPPYIRKLATVGPIVVWLVDGLWVRTNCYLDFICGGHSRRYDFIPDGQVWIDNSQPKEEWAFITAHELFEYALMDKQMKYGQAHPMANEMEKLLRGIQQQAGKALND